MINSKKKLKILFTQQFKIGGALMYTHFMANHLVDLGHEVSCVYIKDRLAKREPFLLKKPKYQRIFLVSLPGMHSWVLRRFLKLFCKKDEFDVVITTGSEGAYLKNLCFENNILHIASHHSSSGYVKKKRHIPKLENLNPWNIGKLLYRFNLHLATLSLLKADLIQCVSEHQKKTTIQELGISENKTTVIYNGVDVNKFCPVGDQKQKRILYGGGLISSKGIDDLLQALSLITKKYPDIKLDILGSGNWEDYQDKVRDLGILGNVKYHGHVSHENIHEYYKQSLIFVLPTKHEAFNLMILEAMASGLPVVATNVSSIPEVVQDEVNGFLVPWNKPKDLAKRIADLLDSPLLIKSMGDKGRELVKRNFVWEKSALELERLIFKNLLT